MGKNLERKCTSKRKNSKKVVSTTVFAVLEVEEAIEAAVGSWGGETTLKLKSKRNNSISIGTSSLTRGTIGFRRSSIKIIRIKIRLLAQNRAHYNRM